MCGILGVVCRDPDVRDAVRRGSHAQRHRGPDATGELLKHVGDWTVALGHQRLAILDLSPSGAQPMASARETSFIVYNGEVYNFIELRDELRALGWMFHGTSDTEVVLAALQQWGIAGATRRFNGMWAFAWLDVERRKLFLCRDRLGVKPLYCCRDGDRILFASEIKAILEMVSKPFALNHALVADYVANASVDLGEATFFVGIHKVPAATYLTIDLSSPGLDASVEPYWSLDAREHPRWTDREAPDRLRELLTDAVRLRLRSDVPVGMMLSGGLDSSSLAVILRRLVGPNTPIHLFSAVSADSRYDESPFIDTMARHVQGEPSRVLLQFRPEEALRHLEEVCWANDEPPAGFSVVASYLIMRLAMERGVTVLLSGQGADELLCGYRKYVGFQVQALLRHHAPTEAARLLWSFWRRGTVLNEFTLGEASRYMPLLRSKWTDVRAEALAPFGLTSLGMKSDETIQERQKSDFTRFSIPPITHYEDRMSMAWSRETRCPFLDHRLVEAFVPAPVRWKLNDGWTKYSLRRAFERDLPPHIVWRRDKKGFDTPEGEWLRTAFRPRVLEVFAPDAAIFRRRLIDREKLLRTYQRYTRQCSGSGVLAPRHVFAPLALELWLRRYERYLTS
jgi:asparagine synthase (glutamine-hydrolysing)